MLKENANRETVFLVGDCDWQEAAYAANAAGVETIAVDSAEAFFSSKDEIKKALCVFVIASSAVDWQVFHKTMLEMGVDIPVFAVSTSDDLSSTIETATPFANFVLTVPVEEASMAKAFTVGSRQLQDC